MARRLHDHWLIGLSTSVLTHEFVTSYQHSEDVEDVVPFSGKLMLPTKLQVLKLHLFFRDEAGKKNQNVSKGEITSKVMKVLKYYWNLAGFETLADPRFKVTKLVECYQDQLKKRNMSNKKSLEERKKFEEDLNKLLDIAHPDLEKKLTQDRIRGNLEGRKSEDLSFLQDQRGERKMQMGKLDEEYSKKKEAQMKRKLGSSVPSSTVTSQDLCEDLNVSFGDSPIKDNRRDEEFNIREKQARRSDYITVELPRDPLGSLEVTGALDRSNITNRQAMQVFSSVLKTARKDGKQVDLQEFVLSTNTIRRRREENRATITENAKKEFLDNMPARLTLHWDGRVGH